MIDIVQSSDAEMMGQFIALVVAGSIAAALFLAFAGRSGRAVAGALALLGSLVVLGLTLTPDPASGSGRFGCATEPVAPLDDIPNVAVFFVPMLFAVVATRRPLVLLFAGPVASAAIEYAQYALPVEGRRCDVDDVLANSAGSVAAVVIGVLILALGAAWRRFRPTPPADVRPETGSQHQVYSLR